MKAVLEVCAHLPEVTYQPGEILIREGSNDGRIFVLLEGTVLVMKGEVRVTRVRSPGALFGEMSILLEMPATATVAAETVVKVRQVEDGAAFLASTPEVALHTARLLAQRLHDTTTYLADVKAQFENKSDHFGMVDRIIGSLLNQQAAKTTAKAPEKADPRL